MKKKWLAIMVLVIALSGGTTAMAQGGDTAKSGGSNQSANSMYGMDMNGKDKNMDMSGSTKDNSMPGMDMSGSANNNNMAGMDRGEGPAKETPANIKILGTYGAVNLSFILIGIWSKWFRRKDGSNGDSK